LDVQSNACLQKATIGWNRYMNWAGDTVKDYQLQTTIDNNTPTTTSLGNPFPTGAPASLRESYDYSIAGLVGDTISFVVIAINADGVTKSKSNVIKLPLNVLRSTGFNYCSNATVADTNVMSMSWIIDTTAQVSNFNIKRSQDGQSFQTIDTVFITANNVFEPSYVDSTANTSSGSYYYKIESQDICGFTLESTVAHTIFLEGTSVSGAINHLTWNPFELTHATVLNYVVYRLKQDGTATTLATLLPDQTTFDDQVGDAVSDNGVFCYRIVSTYVLNLPDLNISKSYVTQSNDICIGKDPVIYIPTAFVPGGINRFFKPVLLFGVEQYDFKIFDRWGKQLYATQDPIAGWDGIYNGEKLPLGGYIYQLKVVGTNGQTYERQGVVTLVR
jgi:gliding motility-associated-like protein